MDFLEIAERFDTVFISNIPESKVNDTVRVILFMYLIDVMYDCNIQLVVSAAVAIESLYVAGELHSKFQRTLSRLIEMQSRDYVKRHQRRYMENI